MALDGEPGWICLMCCNSDSKHLSPRLSGCPILVCMRSQAHLALLLVLFSAVVIQWVTSRDSTSTHSDFLSQSLPQSHNGDEFGHVRSPRSKQRTSRTGEPPSCHQDKSTSASAHRRGSVDTKCCSSKKMSSTEAIVDDVAEISLDVLDLSTTAAKNSSNDDGLGDAPTPRPPPPTASEVHVHVNYGS